MQADDQQKGQSVIPRQSSTSTNTATTSTTSLRNISINDPRTSRLQEFDRYDENRIQSPPSVISIKQEIKPEVSMTAVDNLVASYVDSTTFLHSPATIHSPMDMGQTVLVSGQSSVSLTSEDLSSDDMASSNGSRMMDPMINMSGMGMINPNAISRRQGSNQSGSSEEMPCESMF